MGYVVSTRIEKIKQSTNSTKLMAHDFRVKVPDYIRRNDGNAILNLGVGQDIQFQAMDSTYLNAMKQKHADLVKKAKEDYFENHKKNLPSNTNFGVCGVVTFGVTDDIKQNRTEEDDGLSDIEADFINRQEKDECVKTYLRNLEKEYGVKILYCVRHSDEKTDHYHFQTINYNFAKNQALYKDMSRAKTAQFGSQLQDLVSESFDGTPFQRGIKNRPKKAKHLDVANMHKKEIETLSSKVANKKNIAEELEQNIQQLNAKHQAMNVDMNYYKTNKSILDKELQNLKTEYQAFKNSDKMKQIDTYKKLKFSTEKLQSDVKKLAVIKQKEIEEIKQMLSEKKELSVDVIKNTDVVEEEGFFLKKQIHAPAGYTFIKSDDFKKLKITAMTIKKIEAENNCSIQDITQNLKVKNELEVIHKKEMDSLHNRYKNEMYTIQFQANKVIENIKQQAQEKLDEKINEMQCIINEQADNLKSFRDKVGNMLHTLKIKFGISESDLNSDDVKFTKSTTNDKSSNFPNK